MLNNLLLVKILRLSCRISTVKLFLQNLELTACEALEGLSVNYKRVVSRLTEFR